MKKGKSPEKFPDLADLWQSRAKPKFSQRLIPGAWDFRNVPRDEIEPCYLYEYSKDSALIVSKITAALERRQYSESAAANKRRSAWFKSNPEPTEDRQRKIWQAKMVSEIGDTVVKTELEPEIHFIINFAEDGIFPEKHWLEIDAERRRKHAVRADRWRVGQVDPASMEAKPLLIDTLESFLELRRLFAIAGLGLKLPDYSGPHVFDVCWARSNRKLKGDFEEWLKNNRPKDEPGFQASAHGGSRRTTPRDLLKALAALRLMRAFKGDASKARDQTDEVCGQWLYREQTAWINAAKKAEEHLVVFQRKMLRI